MQPDIPPPLPPKTRHSAPLPDRPPVPPKNRYSTPGEVASSSPPPPPLPARSRQQEPISTPVPPPLPAKPYYYDKRGDTLRASVRQSREVVDTLEVAPDEPPPLPPLLAERKSAELVFGTKRISELTFKNYDAFVLDKEKALIMFYDSTDNSDPAIAGEFGLAALSTQNKKYSYGAVDCAADPAVCCQHQVNTLPILKLYSNGFEVSTLCCLEKFASDQMNMLLAMAPVLTQPRAGKH